MDWLTGPSLGIAIAVIAGLGALIALGVRYLEARSRRDEEAARLQMALAEPLARAPALAGSAVRPVVSLSVDGRPRVELTGWVSSADVRDAVLRAVEDEVERLGRRVRIVDRLDVAGGQGPVSRPA